MKKSMLFVSMVNSLLPIRKRTILFKSFSGQYSDSPRAISEYIHANYPDIHIVWAKSEANNNEFPEYAEVIDIDSAKYHEYEWRAHAIVDNVASIRSSWIHDNENSVKKALIKYYTRKRKQQLSISSWHGVPLKRIGMDSITFKRDCYLSTNCNYVLSGNEHSKRCLQSSLGNAVPVIMSGIPRNDKLINDANNISEVKKKLGLPVDKKVLLYAPTFRQDVTTSGVMQMQSFNFEALLEQLHNKFGNEWCFVFRTHMHVTKEIKKAGILENLGDLIIDGNTHDDMADYLMCADMLITDYSSSMFDYIFTKRPCLLYVPDLEEYEKKERGFYIDISKLPFPISNTVSGLMQNIESFDLSDYSAKCDSFLRYLGNIEDGASTKRIADDIISVLNGKKDIDSFMKDRRN